MTIVEHIVPGAELEEAERPGYTDRGYWFVACPACGEIHERQIQEYWDDDPTGDGGIIKTHYFVCMETGVHFKLSPDYPFAVTMQKQFRKPAIRRATGDDEPIPF